MEHKDRGADSSGHDGHAAHDHDHGHDHDHDSGQVHADEAAGFGSALKLAVGDVANIVV